MLFKVNSQLTKVPGKAVDVVVVAQRDQVLSYDTSSGDEAYANHLLLLARLVEKLPEQLFCVSALLTM
jgi:acyl CoA:acetate/3-ketoacid CoA transferase